MISKKLFCSQQIHKKWIHEQIFVNNSKKGLYNTGLYGCGNIFWNEIGQFFLNMLGKNISIYYVTCSPKHNIIYDNECYNFFNLWQNLPNNVVMPKNLKNLRELQCNDLMYFYENLILESFFIISKIKNNFYYYDMIIFVKNEFNINDLLKINFNIINIEGITPIFNVNINYNFMKQLFNFDELSSYNFCEIQDQRYYDIVYNPKHKELQEYRDLKEYEYEQVEVKNISVSKMQQNDLVFWKLDNDYNGVVTEIMDQKIMFKYYFSNFGFHWFVLNYEFDDKYTLQADNYTYPVNDTFLLTYDNIVKPVAIVKRGGEICNFDQQYDIGSMLELIDILNGVDKYCVEFSAISIPKIKYNTSYKCRLKIK